MDLLLGIDIGTTGTKAMVIDAKGDVLKTSYKGYSLYNRNINWVEQDALQWWDALVHTVRDCTKDGDIRKRVKALSISSQGGSLVPVDSNGKPLRMAIVWMDNRAIEQKKWVNKIISDDSFNEITGRPLSQGGNIVQIKWLKDNEPDAYKATYKFLSTIDFINFRLTGFYAIDPTNAAMTKLLDIRRNDWSEDILGVIGLSRDKLPEIIKSGDVIANLCSEAAGQLGLSEEVKVISGGHDQYCAALGAGVVNSGDVMLSTGTAWVILSVFDSFLLDKKGAFITGCHILEGKWGLLSALSTGGVVLEWFRNNFAGCMKYSDNEVIPEPFCAVDEKASKKDPGSNGLMFFPHFNGAKFPEPAFQNKGTLLGLDLSHDRYNLSRSIMEGVAYEIKLMLESLQEIGVTVNKLKMLGGAVKSALWPQIVADVTGIQITVHEITDATCLGASILSGKGAGLFRDEIDGFKRLVKGEIELSPNSKNAAIYKKLFVTYKHRLSILKQIYSNNINE